jgi:hypothetical protein
MTMQIRELELQLLEVQQRLEQAESEIKLLKHPPDRMWMTPQEIEEYTQGKYTATQIVRICKQVIERPGDLPFKIGEHITFDDNERGRFFRINYPEFDRVKIGMMRDIA